MAALATACSTRLHRHADGLAPMAELTAIDSMMWSQPDSAFTQLLAFADNPLADSLDAFNGHYFHLLLSELLYKNDYAQTNRDDLLRAVAYLDSLCGTSVPQPDDPSRQEVISRHVPAALAFLDARAHYIDGAGYYEMDSAVPACRQYLQALEVMETRFNEKDLVGHLAQFMALAYTHLTVVFSDQYLHEQAIRFGKQALSYYNRYDATPWHQAWISEAIGLNHEMLERLDSAFYYYQQAYSYLPDTIGLTYRDIKTAQVRLTYQCEMGAESSILALKQLLDAADNEEEYCARCLTIGDVFYSEQQYDSAWPYLQKVFCETTNTALKKQAAEWLAHICKESGRDAESSAYSEFLLPFANQEENASALKTQLTNIHMEYEQNKQEIDHKQDVEKTNRVVNRIVFSLLIGITIIALLYFHGKRRNERLQAEKTAISDRLETERLTHTMQQAALGGRLKKSNELLRNARKQLKSLDDANHSPLTPGVQVDFDAFFNNPVCKHILEVVSTCHFKPKMDFVLYKNHALDRTQTIALLAAADTSLGRFTTRIQNRYPSLTKDDLVYCCLCLLGLNEADIAALTQRAYSTVCERNRKIKRILKTDAELNTALWELL